MQKQLFLLMLGLGTVSGMAVLPTPAYAAIEQAQTIKVTGQVVDQDGEPLLGATIKAKGSSTGTVTDLDGKFSLSVPSNATLVISYIGYKDYPVAVRGNADLGTIKLTGDDTMLDQVVVVGYGTQKKADLTGSVAVVNTEEMKRVSNSNISTMLEGKVSGVQVTSDGQPGADPSVRIRGLGSFNGTSPLYVIDGVPMGTTIRDFSPNDIATIQVLKDGAAAAIYGSRAANGVIIITTKNGQKEQPMKIDYKGYFGIDVIPSGTYDVMDADQYSTYLGQACNNSGTPLPGGYYAANPSSIISGRARNTDLYYFQGFNQSTHYYDDTNTNWFDEVFKTGIRQNHNINLSGGGKNNTYNIALDYYNQKGTLEGAGPNFERYTARVNNTFEKKFIKIRTSMVYSHSNQDNMSLSNASEYVQGLYGDVSNVLKSTLLMQPTIKAYDESTWCLDDKVGAASSYSYDAYGYGVYYDNVHGDISASNPLLVNNKLKRNTLVDRFLGTISADVDILDMIGVKSDNHKLTYKINLSYNKTISQYKTWIGSWIQSNRVYLDKSNETLTEDKNTYTDGLIENTLTYDGKLGQHHFNVVLGQTYEEENWHYLGGNGKEYSEPYFLQLGNGASRDSWSSEYKHAITSFIGRLNYDFADKYLLSVTVRRDGSSRLTKAIRWGTFPSVSAGWRVDKEKFFKVDPNVINLLKLRGSYGELGNESIGEYVGQATLVRNNMSYSFGNTPVYGSSVSTFVDSNLAWEKKKSWNIGFDIAMFNNRLEFSAEWYKNISKDLLYSVAVPANAGVANSSVTMNAASMENSGLEFSATYRNHDHPLKWEVSGNIYTTRNKVTNLGPGQDYRTDGAYITYVGQEVGQFYGWKYQGIARTQEDLDNHATQSGANIGDCLYEDVNGDGVINDQDQTVLGSGMPKANFGLSCHLEYHGFDLSISTFGALGFHATDDIYNALNSCYGYSNKDVSMLNANQWSEDGFTYISDVPRTYAANSATYAWNDLFSDRKIQNAAYWKIANIELGYNFPDKWFHGYVTGVRLYVSAQNVYTFTAYKGYNVDFYPGTFTPGYNFCSFPSARTFMTGVLFSF